METPRRRARRKLHPNQSTEWQENLQQRRSPLKPVKPDLNKLNRTPDDILSGQNDSDSDLDRNVLEILSPVRVGINTGIPATPPTKYPRAPPSREVSGVEMTTASPLQKTAAHTAVRAKNSDRLGCQANRCPESHSSPSIPLTPFAPSARATSQSPSYDDHLRTSCPNDRRVGTGIEPLHPEPPAAALSGCSERGDKLSASLLEISTSSDSEPSRLHSLTRKAARRVAVISSDDSSEDKPPGHRLSDSRSGAERNGIVDDQYQNSWNGSVISSKENLPHYSDSEPSEYSSGAGVLALNLPNGFRRPFSCREDKSTSDTEDPSVLRDFGSSTVLPTDGRGSFVVALDSDEEDALEVDQLLSHRSPRKRPGKRMSTWSMVDGGEIVTISSDEESDFECTSTPTHTGIKDGSENKLRLTASTSYGLPNKQPLLLKDGNTPRLPATPTPKTTALARPNIVMHSKRKHATELQEYALNLYNSLNHQVFGNNLPQGCHSGSFSSNHKCCEIIWSKTLMTTAGRAVIKRSIYGSDSTPPQRKVFIELATKVVDSEERIRNTLSHEMCHLAVWLIDEAKDGGHGRPFNAWAKRVMRAQNDIHITSRHSYQIVYRYEWKCVACNQIYGRHSKSIDTSTQRCGVCKGELKALFGDTRSTGWAGECSPLPSS
ncbi:SprT-like family-domain-containing protein [Cantharellus anzutake]|uniref:SprT-like family-domain-containing protein n=1 Tax=Cantharellus anzutake TaxID=1750568 RepID=UPI0019066B3D|nr:SprT-like family-domain-containing protein [Cantharellus anzutake]KAF8344059.1 SprT-like family-domain-containing protein [Cantharellus anzutake]